MVFEWDPIVFTNVILCIVIVILGIICWMKSREHLPLYIAAAFGLFGISHAATLAGLKDALTFPLIAIRTLAYVLVIIALILYLRSSMMVKETRQAWIEYYRDDGNKEQ